MANDMKLYNLSNTERPAWANSKSVTPSGGFPKQTSWTVVLIESQQNKQTRSRSLVGFSEENLAVTSFGSDPTFCGNTRTNIQLSAQLQRLYTWISRHQPVHCRRWDVLTNK